MLSQVSWSFELLPLCRKFAYSFTLPFYVGFLKQSNTFLYFCNHILIYDWMCTNSLRPEPMLLLFIEMYSLKHKILNISHFNQWHIRITISTYVRSESSRTKAIKTTKILVFFSVCLFKIGSIRYNTQVITCFQLLHGVRKVFFGWLVMASESLQLYQI
jgi:hypothetical protein